MSYTATESTTYSYTTVDIEKVVRRFGSDILMIAQSTLAITEAEAAEYAHDVDVLAKNGYLKRVDVTLFSGTTEVRAAQYFVNTSAGELSMSRPGGVMWPRVGDPELRVVLSYVPGYTAEEKQAMKPKLKISWGPTNADTSHAGLASSGGRDYASNGWGMERKDFQ